MRTGGSRKERKRHGKRRRHIRADAQARAPTETTLPPSRHAAWRMTTEWIATQRWCGAASGMCAADGGRQRAQSRCHQPLPTLEGASVASTAPVPPRPRQDSSIMWRAVGCGECGDAGGGEASPGGRATTKKTSSGAPHLSLFSPVLCGGMQNTLRGSGQNSDNGRRTNSKRRISEIAPPRIRSHRPAGVLVSSCCACSERAANLEAEKRRKKAGSSGRRSI